MTETTTSPATLESARRRWRRSGRRTFAAVVVFAVLGFGGTFLLPAGYAYAVVAAGTMVLVAGLCAGGAYCLGQAHALEGLRLVRPAAGLPR